MSNSLFRPARCHKKNCFIYNQPQQRNRQVRAHRTLYTTTMSQETGLLVCDQQQNYGSTPFLRSEPVHVIRKRKGANPLLYLFMALVLLVLLFGSGTVYLLSQNSQDLIQQSVEVDVHSLELSKLTTSGLELKLKVMANVNYDDINGKGYFKQLLKLGGGMLQSVTIQSYPMELSTVLDDENVVLGSVDVPTMVVDIRNGGSTPLELLIKVKPKAKNMMRLAKRILDDPKEVLKMYGRTVVQVTIGVIPLGSFPIKFEQLLEPLKYFDDVDLSLLEFEDVALERSDQGYDIFGLVSVPNPTFRKSIVGFEVPVITLDVFVPGCDGSVATISDGVTTEPFTLSPNDESLKVNFSTSVTHLNHLLKHCEDNSVPITTLVKHIMDNETVALTIKNVQIHGSSILTNILSFVQTTVDYHAPLSIDDILQDVSMDKLEFSMDNTGMTFIKGEVNVVIDTKGADLTVLGLRGMPKLSYHGEEFANIDLTEWHSCLNELHDDRVLFVKVSLEREPLNVTNAAVFRSLANEMFLRGSATVDVDAMLDVQLDVAIAQFEMDGVQMHTKTKITKGLLLGHQL